MILMPISQKNLCVLLFALMFTVPCFAGKIVVGTIGELQKAILLAKPANTVRLRDGIETVGDSIRAKALIPPDVGAGWTKK